jgi:signal transduction histidine kinase
MQPPGWQEAPSEREEPAGGQTPWGVAKLADSAPERRFAEEIGRYEDFLRSTVDWLWETDAGLTLSYASSPVALKLGIPAQVLVGRPLMSLGSFATKAGDAGGTERRVLDAIAARRPFRDAVFTMTGATDREVAYRLSGVPYFDGDSGSFAGYRGTAVAASEAAETRSRVDEEAARALAETLEEALIRQQDLSWRLSQTQAQAPPQKEPEEPAPKTAAPEGMGDNPLARTAHELRTPLNAVVGYADLALKQMFGPLGERYLDCFRTIREAGRHLDNLVTHLQSSQRTAAEEALAAEAVDVAGIAAKAKAMIALAARDAEVDVSRVGPMAGGRILGDPTACTQILVNLLSNAVKFTPAGGSVGLETLVGPDASLRIAIWDTGIGIPEDEQARIFEDSYRATAVTGAGGPAGLGLGLAISRDLARAMGGDITVSSQPGQGARFILSLPLAKSPAAGPAAE